MTRFALSTAIAFAFVALAPELPAIATGDLFQQAVTMFSPGGWTLRMARKSSIEIHVSWSCLSLSSIAMQDII